jgi:HAD superfamily hydrolase (TIGR01450 family)
MADPDLARPVWVLDLDGVVYAGAALLPGAGDAVTRLRAAGRRVAFLTNNSAQRPARVAQKLRRLGVPCDDREVITSGSAAADLLVERGLGATRGVHVLGTDDLRAEVEARGLRCTDEADAEAVLVGFDPGFSYAGLATAFRAARAGAAVVACNRDREFPSDGGVPWPACAAMLGALEGALGRSADVEVGKPSPYMLERLAAALGFGLADCLVVGDSLESDIEMARRAGVPSVWIHGGVTLAGCVAQGLE